MTQEPRNTGNDWSARRAVQLGLLRIAPPDQPFTSRSGSMKEYVTDLRGAGANLALRRLIVRELEEQLRACPAFDVIGGIAKAGLMWACWLAWEHDLPYATVLPSGPRTTGLRRGVEGDVRNRRVLLIDNWVKSGTSARQSMTAVDRAGGSTVALLAAVNEEMPRLGIPVRTVWNIEELLDAARSLGHFLPSEVADIRSSFEETSE